jgi:hypothetical protein
MVKRRKRLVWTVAFLGSAIVVLVFIASAMAHRLDPYIRQQVLLYLQDRFDSEVEIQALRIHMPNASSLHLLLTRRRGAVANVSGEGVVMRHNGRRDVPPMFVMKSFSFDVDLAAVFDSFREIQSVKIDGMQIIIPPKAERASFDESSGEEQTWQNKLIIKDVIVTNSRLTILPKDPAKTPLTFDLHQVHLQAVGKEVSMRYAAALTNPKPPGEIVSDGRFGPWAASEPGDTPLNGDYHFDDADLGVFAGISGTLHSMGHFEGTLSSIDVTGDAAVPNFSLKRSGNKVPLRTHFQVHVDGTSGDTILQPVIGTLGSTTFRTSGTVIKNEPATHRSIDLNVTMNQGNLDDVLRLAMKGSPFMIGQIDLKTKIVILPVSGKVREKLLLDGTFEVTGGHFQKSTIQDQIDALSRRSQGQPKNEEIDEVVSQMGGRFKLENEQITFDPVSFSVPGSGIDLMGSYDLDEDILDFQGTLRMQATVSQTMTGWKHWVLKPLDSFFAKQGAGTLLNIKVTGSAEKPAFGLNRGGNKK